jgi:hypothetical protein
LGLGDYLKPGLWELAFTSEGKKAAKFLGLRPRKFMRQRDLFVVY